MDGSVLLRDCLGEVLRAERMRRGLTLREVSSSARVSLGYISEIERGHKEASSELLAALCDALDVRVSEVLVLASQTAAAHEGRPVGPHALGGAEVIEVGTLGSGDVVASAA